MSLLDVWYEQTNGTTTTTTTTTSDTTNNTTNKGFGMLAYEIRIQVGIVLRQNIQLGMKEDCWRCLYVQELQSYGNRHSSNNNNNNSDVYSFGQFLMQFFPQLKPIFRHNTTTNTSPPDFGNVIIKYYPHPLTLDNNNNNNNTNSSITSPPPRPDHHNSSNVSCYQTLGTLDEPTSDIFARFEHHYTLCFHDLVLEVI